MLMQRLRTIVRKLAVARTQPFDTAPRWLRWFAAYFLHALVGAGIMTLVLGLVIIGKLDPLWQERLRWLPLIAGAVMGIALAEWSRRRGTLLANRRSTS